MKIPIDIRNEPIQYLFSSIKSNGYCFNGYPIDPSKMPELQKAIEDNNGIEAARLYQNINIRGYECIAGPLSNNVRWYEIGNRIIEINSR